jgi:hypothetical protein
MSNVGLLWHLGLEYKCTMSKFLKLGVTVLGACLALPALASPLGPPPKKTGKHHGHSRTIPARHNAGRPMHS